MIRGDPDTARIRIPAEHDIERKAGVVIICGELTNSLYWSRLLTDGYKKVFSVMV
jgi:hypothetical protein